MAKYIFTFHGLVLLFAAICIANALHQYGVLQQFSEEEIDSSTAYLNYVRSLAFPHALRMNCLTWSEHLAAKATRHVEKCRPAHDSHYEAVSFDAKKKTLKEDIFEWATEKYELYSEYCEDKDDKNCINYKSIYNDLSDNFGCASAKCDSLPGLPKGGYLTVCTFDGRVYTHRRPYEIDSKKGRVCVGCSYPKNECISNLCCYPQNLIGMGDGTNMTKSS